MQPVLSRRAFLHRTTLAAAGVAASARFARAANAPFKFRYCIASCMYGTLPLKTIVPEVPKTGAEYIDLWPRVHGNQREQLDEMGHEAFTNLIRQHGVKLGVLTRYDLGPFGLLDEMQVARKLGASLIICGGKGPRDRTGPELKAAVKDFLEKMKPHLAGAEEAGVTIGIENHGNNLIQSPDSMRWLVELAPSPNIGIALAPYHLPQKPDLLAGLIADLGDRLKMFYAWQYGMGCMQKLPKEQELLQMPGRGDLDFQPLIDALKKIRYRGFTEIFMHPVPRGIPILETAPQVTTEINRARAYLEKLV